MYFIFNFSCESIHLQISKMGADTTTVLGGTGISRAGSFLALGLRPRCER